MIIKQTCGNPNCKKLPENGWRRWEPSRIFGWLARRKTAKYCCSTCKSQAHYKPTKRTQTEKCDGPNCHKLMEDGWFYDHRMRRVRLARRGSRFCSDRCRIAWRRVHNDGLPIQKLKPPKPVQPKPIPEFRDTCKNPYCEKRDIDGWFDDPLMGRVYQVTDKRSRCCSKRCVEIPKLLARFPDPDTQLKILQKYGVATRIRV